MQITSIHLDWIAYRAISERILIRANLSPIDAAYVGLLDELIDKIRSAQVKAALAVNAGLVRLYWEIGNIILQKLQSETWGAKVIERLARDLNLPFPI